jgi:CIC family chloride channel protein
VLTSYFFLGQAVLYPFEIHETFEAREFPYYIILGIFGGLVSVYFTRTYIYIEKLFGFIKSWYGKLLVGGICLGILVFFFPALYGEGYAAVNASLHGDISELFKNSVLYPYRSSLLIVFLMMFVIILLKVIATSVTFGSGGIGGIFAPTLFTGAFTGLFIGKLINVLEIGPVSETSFALVGMCGLISGVLHAPLTAIFLIAEITSGYALFVPLMITAAFSYATTRIFVSNSVYTHQLARRGELITNHKDRAILSLMKVKDMLETNFHTITIEANLGDLVKIVSRSKRNIFPVVEDDKTFRGMILMDDIRDIMFRPELYEKAHVRNLMIIPATIVNIDDTMEEVAHKFQKSGKYVLPVLADGEYMGFVSRANVFSEYRKMLHDFSDD